MGPSNGQAVRDLLWVVNTPSFVEGANVADDQVLSVDQVDEQHLHSVLAAANAKGQHRVGRYFETLLHYWLAHVRQVDVVAAGLQVKDGRRTIGEIDFLYRDEREQLVHCEASVKFFLHLAGHSPSAFPGPNATDNYERKTDKLFDKQLRLSEEHAPDVQRREAFVKGIMFYRAGSDGTTEVPAQLPARLPAAHQQGQWVHESELDALGLLHGDVVFAVADKPHWLAPMVGAAILEGSAFVDEMAMHFATLRHPLMVSVRSMDDTAAELKRVFVVADDWPAPHTAR